ncbi:histone acetyltransferase HPA2 [Nonlabens ulvanivorans]|nr:histone acetyltransferase HPA2 [Nonlabens ulvanivorans]
MVIELDAFLAITDGDEHSFYDQFNKLDQINEVVVVYKNEIPVGCGALKKYDVYSIEIKRMYTKEAHRGNGIASQVLMELEQWARELSFKKCILETGINQPAAIALYKKRGYSLIDNYGQYAGKENSYCFEKKLS